MRHRTCNLHMAGSNPGWAPLRSGLGQTTYTCVPLSPSSIIWYRPKGGMISLAGKVTAGLVESNGSLPPGLWLMSHVDWLPRNRDPTLVIEDGTTLLKFNVYLWHWNQVWSWCRKPCHEIYSVDTSGNCWVTELLHCDRIIKWNYWISSNNSCWQNFTFPAGPYIAPLGITRTVLLTLTLSPMSVSVSIVDSYCVIITKRLLRCVR